MRGISPAGRSSFLTKVWKVSFSVISLKSVAFYDFKNQKDAFITKKMIHYLFLVPLWMLRGG